MRYSLLGILVCPYCRQSLKCTVLREKIIDRPLERTRPILCHSYCGRSRSVEKREDRLKLQECFDCIRREIVGGMLTCSRCGRTFSILKGVPRMLPDEYTDSTSVRSRSEDVELRKRTMTSFGYEWTRFSKLFGEYEKEFLDWIYPLQPGFFGGKTVLDAGCGAGRHMYHAARFGGETVGFDLSNAVDVAYRHTLAMTNAHVVQSDIHLPPFKAVFDFVYSIGVLHHLSDFQGGLKSLADLLAPQGLIFVWVYGKEYNLLMTEVVELARRVSTSLPLETLDRMSLFPALGLELVSNGCALAGRFQPFRSFVDSVPYGKYLCNVASFTFEHKRSMVFDFLSAPTSRYFGADEIRPWFESAGLSLVSLGWRNRNSWRCLGEKRAQSRQK